MTKNELVIGVGEYPRSKVRFPSSHGAPFIYMMAALPAEWLRLLRGKVRERQAAETYPQFAATLGGE